MDSNGMQKVNICIFMMAGLAALMLFCLILHLSIGSVRAFSPYDLPMPQRGFCGGENENEVWFSVDSKAKSGNHISLVGWAFVLGEDVITYEKHIMLRNPHSGMFFRLPTAFQWRNDVTAHMQYSYDMENNFNRSGWVARVNANQLSHGVYELFILYRSSGRNILVDTEMHVQIGGAFNGS